MLVFFPAVQKMLAGVFIDCLVLPHILSPWQGVFERGPQPVQFIQNPAASTSFLQYPGAHHVVGFGRSQVVIGSRTHALTITLAGARATAPEEESAALLGRAQARAVVKYVHPWPRVTVRYRVEPGAIVKSEYHLEAGFTAQTIRQIRVRYNRPLKLDAQGRLIVPYPLGTVEESAPVAWQEIRGRKMRVPVKFRRQGSREIGFEVTGFDSQYPLVIDPSLTWNTFLGGGGEDQGNAMAVDGSGNLYVCGTSTASWGTPKRAYGGYYDAFAAKLDSSGNLVWNTFLGAGGSGGDYGDSIAVDGSGHVYVGGHSDTEWGTPVQAFNGGSNDAFAAKLDSDGNLIWNTFLGGGGNDGNARIAVDGDNNVYVGGQSDTGWGTPVRVFSGGAYDAFAAKLDSHGTLVWNTFLGGNDLDLCSAITVDGGKNVYVSGPSRATWGTPKRAYDNSSDVFAAKLDSGGNLLWNTFLGGAGFDIGGAMSMDGGGQIYVCGTSDAPWGSPVRAYSSGNDSFAAKLDSGGNLLWNTFLGGAGDDWGGGITPDGTGKIFLTGDSSAAWGAPARAFGGGAYDDFCIKLDTDGTLVWNMFLGGSGDDEYDGGTLAVDNNGSVYAVGYSNLSWGSPVRAFDSSYDMFAAKIFDTAPNTPTPTPSSTFTATFTETASPVSTFSFTPTLSTSATPTPALTGTFSPSPSFTHTVASGFSATPSLTPASSPTVPSVSGTHFTLLHPLARPRQLESIRLRIQLDQGGRVLAEVYNLMGQKVEVVADGWFGAGEQEVLWRAEKAASGLYILRVWSPGEGREEKFKVVVLQ